MNLLFCIDRPVLGQLAVCLRSVAKNGGAARCRVFVMHSDLDDGIRENLSRDFPTMEFQFIPVPRSMFEGFPVTDRYPREIYYRLAAPILLQHPVVEYIGAFYGATVKIFVQNQLLAASCRIRQQCQSCQKSD